MTAFWVTLASTFGLTKLADITSYKDEKKYQPNKFLYVAAVIILIFVAGLRSGAGLFFISALTLYHCFGSSFSSRYILYGI